MPGRKSLGHVFRQRATERAHAFEPHWPAIAAVWRGREEEQPPAAFAPERDDFRQAIGRRMMRFVNEQSLAGEIGGQIVGGESVQRGMGTRERMIERPLLLQVLDNALDRTELALACAFDQGSRHLNRGHSNARTIREGDNQVIAFDEALFDLFLRRRDECMRELLAQPHRHERHNLDGLARASGLFDEDVLAGTANIGDQSDLIGTQVFRFWLHRVAPE